MSLFRRTPEDDTKKFVKGLCKSMLLSFNLAENHYKNATSYGELAAFALDTRPGWTRVESSKGAATFEHQSGDVIQIDFKEDSLKSVVEDVAFTEVQATLDRAGAGREQQTGIHMIASDVISEFFRV